MDSNACLSRRFHAKDSGSANINSRHSSRSADEDSTWIKDESQSNPILLHRCNRSSIVSHCFPTSKRNAACRWNRYFKRERCLNQRHLRCHKSRRWRSHMHSDTQRRRLHSGRTMGSLRSGLPRSRHNSSGLQRRSGRVHRATAILGSVNHSPLSSRNYRGFTPKNKGR